jgi:hypothetical protein
MFAPIRMRSAAIGTRGTAFIARRISLPTLVCVVALATSACSAPPPAPLGAVSAADADAPAPRSAYRSVIGAYRGARPVDPKPWTERNQNVAPAEKP